jgi:HEAT repeat protein
MVDLSMLELDLHELQRFRERSFIKKIAYFLVKFTLGVSLIFLMPPLALSPSGGETVWAAPPPVRPIPEFLKRVDEGQVTITASSTHRGFSVDNLFRQLGWRAWGSLPSDRRNAWLNFEYETLFYLSMIHFVPGDEREPSFYKKCGRPARVKALTAEGEELVIQLPNQRHHQYIDFDPPLVTRSLKLKFETAYGTSETGGVCLAHLDMYVHADPLKSIPKLKSEITEAIAFVKNPLTFEEGERALLALGPIATQRLIERLDQLKPETQARFLNVIARIGDSPSLKLLKSKGPLIHPLNGSTFRLTLASLGDEESIVSLLKGFKESSESERLKRLVSLARTRDPRHFPLILSSYGEIESFDQTLLPLIRLQPKHYTAVLEKYRQTKKLSKRSALLKLLGAIDHKRAAPLLKKMLSVKDNPMMLVGAIGAASFSQNKKMRPYIRKFKDSPFVIVRRALVETLTRWGERIDLNYLRDLAFDKSISVRARAISSLGHFEGTMDVLRKYALEGPDALSAEEAAKAWLRGPEHADVKTPLKLLDSTYSSVRKLGIHALKDYGELVCEPLGQLFLMKAKRLDESDGDDEIGEVTLEMWPTCARRFLDQFEKANIAQRIIVLQHLKLWRPTEARAFILSQLKDPDPKIRAEATDATRLTIQPKRAIRSLRPVLGDDDLTVKCRALLALSHLGERSVQPLLEETIKAAMNGPPTLGSEWLVCTLRSVELLKIDSMAPLLDRAYRSWMRSIAFIPYRLATINALSALSHPQKLSTLMEAMGDIDANIRAAAERGLRR